MNNQISNKIEIITGASRGIGRKVAEQLASLGIATVINYHSNEEEAKEVVKGSTINAIAPGPIKTELFMEGKSEEQIGMLSKMNSFERLGETEDIASIIELLVSDKAHWITGQTIKVNGGFI